MKFKIKTILTIATVVSFSITSCYTNKTLVYKKINKPVNNSISKEVKSNHNHTEKPVLLGNSVSTKSAVKDNHKEFKVNLPEINREFRAAWVATVANINWPSKRNLSTEQQKEEAIKLLNILEEHNFNAVIFQARPSGDALYKSNFEPWSYFLTGETGKSPYPYYDPLEFWIEEAHKRGIELHVWLNPYRAHHSSGGAVANESVVKKMPEQIVRLKNGMYWFDPADKRTQNHVSNVVKDLVSRYDIDGVHFDDYFYPYASYNGGADFPDNSTWLAYQRAGGKLSRSDWRRDNVNTIIERVYKEIKKEKPHVKFGISPFGIWKPGFPAGITGSSQYDELYADAKLWLNKGWVDYFSPQLYWPIESKGQSFPKLLEWWKSENTHNRHLWPGLNTVEVKVPNKTSEIVNQVKVTGDILQNNIGTVHWSIAGLTKNPEMLNSLKSGPYKTKALVPKMDWIHTSNLDKPKMLVKTNSNEIDVNWKDNDTKNVSQWAIYSRYNDNWDIKLVDAKTISTLLPKFKNGQKLNTIALKSIDRIGKESDYVAQQIN